MSCLHEAAHAIEQGRRLVSGWLPMVVRFRFEVYRRRAGRIMTIMSVKMAVTRKESGV